MLKANRVLTFRMKHITTKHEKVVFRGFVCYKHKPKNEQNTKNMNLFYQNKKHEITPKIT